ncbi:MAG: precorrin-8X methylmutase [Eubacteriales bacterium]|nr:precorrin-8X methylmutase [Eubacteriales bacterium]
MNGTIRPADIEKRSLAIITEELGGRTFPDGVAEVVKRVIHTSADFDYADNLCFSENAVERAKAALAAGATVVTDTNMALAGISKPALAACGGRAVCFMADEDVAREAKARGVTRAAVSMEKAALIEGPVIFAVGNAPTALLRLHELIEAGETAPALVVGVPVGFVNVVESKELFLGGNTPYIVARGRKGGSNVAAAIVNALLYQLYAREGF